MMQKNQELIDAFIQVWNAIACDAEALAESNDSIVHACFDYVEIYAPEAREALTAAINEHGYDAVHRMIADNYDFHD